MPVDAQAARIAALMEAFKGQPEGMKRAFIQQGGLATPGGAASPSDTLGVDRSAPQLPQGPPPVAPQGSYGGGVDPGVQALATALGGMTLGLNQSTPMLKPR